MYNVLINPGHVTNEHRYLVEIFYLDCRRFAVYDVLVLSNCNHNSINAWKIRSILFRVLLFLKCARHIVEREKTF